MSGPRVQGAEDFSVPVTAMVPRELHALLRAGARRHDTSVSALLVELARRGLVAASKPQPKFRARSSGTRRRFWSAEDTATLRRMHAEGKSDGAIGKVLHWGQGTVSRHRDALGLPPLFPGRPKKNREQADG